MINAVIIDDENGNTNVLKTFLSEYCPEVAVIGTSDDPLTAVALIKQKSRTWFSLISGFPG